MQDLKQIFFPLVLRLFTEQTNCQHSGNHDEQKEKKKKRNQIRSYVCRQDKKFQGV